MSANIQAADVSLKVRYSSRGSKSRGETEESQVEIYEDEDTVNQSPTGLRSQEVRPLTQNKSSAIKRSPFRATAVTLGVLYLLISAGIYMRYILITLENQNLETERDQLNISLKQAETRYLNLTEETKELQTRYDNLTKCHSQLEDSIKEFLSYFDFPGGNPY